MSKPSLKYDIVVEHPNNNGYVAQVLNWPYCVVEAPTRVEAIAQIRAAILERLAKAEIVTIEIEPEQIAHPWLPFAGDWANDPTFDDFVAEIARYRRELDEQEMDQTQEAKWQKPVVA